MRGIVTGLFSELLENNQETEARLLRELTGDSAELADWSASVKPVLTRILEVNQISQPIVARVYNIPFNAHALPHQTIVLAKSLVNFCRDDAGQIAFVVAHEVAHIVLGHSRERMRTGKLMSAVGTTNLVAGAALKLFFGRAYSREQEYEADRTAVSYCSKAGYAPAAATTFLQRIESSDQSSSLFAEFLGMHPPIKERVFQLSQIQA